MAIKTEKISLERLVNQGMDLEVPDEEKHRKKGKRHMKKHKFSVHIKTQAGKRKTK